MFGVAPRVVDWGSPLRSLMFSSHWPDILQSPLSLALFSLPGHWEILIILLVVMLLFGNRLPGMARNLGRSFIEFKKGIKGQGGEEKDPKLPGTANPDLLEQHSKEKATKP